MIASGARRAFTLVEVVVALTLSALFGIMVVQALDSTSERATTNIMTADAQTASRETVDELQRALTSARLPIECQGLNKEASSTCLNFTVDQNGSPVLYANDSCLIFRAYARVAENQFGSDTSSKEALRPSDLVMARVTSVPMPSGAASETLQVSRVPSESLYDTREDAATYEDMCNGREPLGGSDTVDPYARSTYIPLTLLDSSEGIFSYRSADGSELDSGADPSEIAIVDARASFISARERSSAESPDGKRAFELNFSAVLSSTGYAN